ncbi:MAG: hypothetical protein A2Y25_00500 [Candidatus Melainabacteria bacterium GWF2_37_15]|nr:MAG: hypothetical protein A2Y25_00500 [Candidatus Melainabacteria bacterium GWF2_37_15]
MLNFDSLSLKAFVAEYQPVFTGGRIYKIQQPTKHELLLTIRAQGANHKLYISVDPKYPHLSVLSREGEELRSIEIPKTPPMFCMLLRKHMEGSKILDIKQPEFERIFEIYFESYSELGERVRMVLSCEFMGKSSNIILYNYENNVILGCAHSVSSEKSRERELAGGLPYIYPPKQNKIDLTKISEEDFRKLIKVTSMEEFGYISRALAAELISACPVEDLYNIAKQTVNLENLNPGISSDMKFYSLVTLDKTIEWQRIKSVNEMLDRYFGYQVFQDKFTRLKNNVLKILKKELNHNKKLLAEQETIVHSQEKQEKYKQMGDNALIDNPKEAQKYYKLYKKAKTAAKHGEEMMQKTIKEIQYLESVEEAVNQAETMQDLREIQQELEGNEPKKQAKDNFKPAEFTSSDGFTIIAGKNNKQNEYILKNSSPEDIWLHVQNIPGSHVIIKSSKDKEVPETTLHEAVYIAAYYSKGRQSSNVPVVYTRRKFVKKPANSKPGFVVYNNEKTLWVNPDQEKVMNLRKKG